MSIHVAVDQSTTGDGAHGDSTGLPSQKLRTHSVIAQEGTSAFVSEIRRPPRNRY